MEIFRATKDDLSEILDLQKSAYLSEAKLINNYLIQPLTQTLEELEKVILKLVYEKSNQIIGSVRAYGI